MIHNKKWAALGVILAAFVTVLMLSRPWAPQEKLSQKSNLASVPAAVAPIAEVKAPVQVAAVAAPVLNNKDIPVRLSEPVLKSVPFDPNTGLSQFVTYAQQAGFTEAETNLLRNRYISFLRTLRVQEAASAKVEAKGEGEWVITIPAHPAEALDELKAVVTDIRDAVSYDKAKYFVDSVAENPLLGNLGVSNQTLAVSRRPDGLVNVIRKEVTPNSPFERTRTSQYNPQTPGEFDAINSLLKKDAS